MIHASASPTLHWRTPGFTAGSSPLNGQCPLARDLHQTQFDADLGPVAHLGGESFSGDH